MGGRLMYDLLDSLAVCQAACSAGMPICPGRAQPDTFGRALP